MLKTKNICDIHQFHLPHSKPPPNGHRRLCKEHEAQRLFWSMDDLYSVDVKPLFHRENNTHNSKIKSECLSDDLLICYLFFFLKMVICTCAEKLLVIYRLLWFVFSYMYDTHSCICNFNSFFPFFEILVVGISMKIYTFTVLPLAMWAHACNHCTKTFFFFFFWIVYESLDLNRNLKLLFLFLFSLFLLFFLFCV